MEKQTFIDAIQSLDEQYQLDRKNASLLSKVFTEARSADLLPNNSLLTNSIVRILQEEFQDDNKDSWIEYFCYELGFGRKNDKLKVYAKDKTEIPLSNAEDLYNLLISEINERQK